MPVSTAANTFGLARDIRRAVTGVAAGRAVVFPAGGGGGALSNISCAVESACSIQYAR